MITQLNYLQTLRGFARPVKLYLFAEGINGFTVDGGIYAVIFNLYLLRLGYVPWVVGGINAAGLAAFGFSSLPAGFLGSRFGNRRMIVAGLCMMFLGCLTLPLAQLFPIAWQLGWLVFIYIFINCGLSLHIANAAPFLMANTPAAERGHVFAAAGALWFLAGFAGNLAGGWVPTLIAKILQTTLNRPAPYRLSLAIAALSIIPAILAMREAGDATSLHNRNRPRLARSSKVRACVSPMNPYGPFGWLICSRLLQVTGVGSVFLFMNVYLYRELGVSLWLIGTIFAIGRLCGVIAAMMVPLLTARWQYREVVIGATTGIALCLLPVILVPHWSAAAVSFVGIAAFTAVRIPAFLIYSMEAVAPAQRAAMSGASEMANGLGFAAVGIAGGFVIHCCGFRALFLLGALLTACGTFVFWQFSRAGQVPSKTRDSRFTARACALGSLPLRLAPEVPLPRLQPQHLSRPVPGSQNETATLEGSA